MSRKILNLTLFPATAEQVADGVVEPPEPEQCVIRETLTFRERPTSDALFGRATDLAVITSKLGYSEAMIGGHGFPLYLVSVLELALRAHKVKAVYSYMEWSTPEGPSVPDGEKVKPAFVHTGFVDV